jgi:hypothetical protein
LSPAVAAVASNFTTADELFKRFFWSGSTAAPAGSAGESQIFRAEASVNTNIADVLNGTVMDAKATVQQRGCSAPPRGGVAALPLLVEHSRSLA